MTLKFWTNGIILAVVLALTSGCLKTREEARAAEMQAEQKERLAAQQRAESLSRIEELNEQIRGLHGKTEALENRIAESERSREEERIKSENAQNAWKEKALVYEQTIEKLEAQLKEAPKAAAKVGVGAKGKLGTFDKAEESFNSKDWKEAILNYQKYRDNNPTGKRYAEATYKIGVSFQELGMKTEAKAFYDEVIEKFPKSVNANRARTRLKTLK